MHFNTISHVNLLRSFEPFLNKVQEEEVGNAIVGNVCPFGITRAFINIVIKGTRGQDMGHPVHH